MFFPDRVMAYREAKRVLRPGGALIFNMWDRIEENEFAYVVNNALGELYPANPPRFLARTPHGQYDTAVYRTELVAAGFRQIEIDPRIETSRSQTPEWPSIAYCQGTPLRNEIKALASPNLQEATRFATAAILERFGSGPITGKISGFVVTAT